MWLYPYISLLSMHFLRMLCVSFSLLQPRVTQSTCVAESGGEKYAITCGDIYIYIYIYIERERERGEREIEEGKRRRR